MRREGRQHGMVRTKMVLSSPYNPRPNTTNSTKSVLINSPPPTAGLFTRVQPKPTNHSKFTGKCGKPRCNDCHLHPCTKSKDKTKGSHKLRSHDIVSNYRLVTWRVVGGRPGLKFPRFSASGILDQLASHDRYIDDDDDHNYDDDEEENNFDVDYRDDGYGRFDDSLVGLNEIEKLGKNNEYNYDHESSEDDTSYCNVGFLSDQVEGDEEGWCLVAELM